MSWRSRCRRDDDRPRWRRGGGPARARRPPARAAAAAVAALAAALLLAPAAGATPARYVYEQCDSVLPAGGIVGATFASNPNPPFQATNTCAEPGGALAISQFGEAGAFSYWTVQGAVPPGGEAESMTITAAVCTGGQPNLVAFAYRPEWSNSCRDEVRTFKEGVSHPFAFYVWLGCRLFQPTACPAGPWIRAHYFATTEVDPVAPTVTDLAGTLLAGGVIRGRQTIRAVGHDRGGGVSSIAVQVNGQAAADPEVSACQVARADNPSVVGTVAATISPCPETTSASWTFDTGAYPFRNGANSLQVCVSDFATLGDPNSTCTAPRTITVDNSCGESSVTGGQVLAARFAKSHKATETTAYGEGAVVTGRLANDAGDPIAGATLCVQARTIGAASEGTAIGTVTTDSKGRYSYRLPAGPNRAIVVGYRHDAFQVARELHIYSHVKAALVAHPRHLTNHRKVRFRGHLPGPKSRGRVVVLQANVVGSKRWITFRKATTRSRGRFRAAYHFVSTERRTTYRFRALVPVQTGYPWLAGKSVPVRVLVTP